MIAVIRSINGVPVRLTDERWRHILTSHTDMKDNLDKLIETVENPDMILKGVSDELRAVKFFKQTHLGANLMVAYKLKDDGFIITAYKTSKIDKIVRRGVIWRK